MLLDGENVRFAIRPVREGEEAAIRRLVPQLYTAASAPDCVLVAASAAAGEIAGVAAVAWRAWGKPPAFPVFVHVTQSRRGRGLARALLAEAARVCREDIERFCTWNAIEEGSDTACFARAVGFDVSRRTLFFEAEGARFHGMIEKIYAALKKRGRIPAHATVVPLKDAPHAQVARFVSASFGSRYDTALAASRGQGAHAYDAGKSVVLVIDGKVQGALLYRWAEGIPQIDVNLVAPSLRRGWANVALLEHAARAGLEAGARRFRFHCDDTVLDTVNLARRANATLLRTSLEFSAPLDRLLERRADCAAP